MSPLPERNPVAQEGINASEDHPLKEFSLLVAAVALLGALAIVLIGLAAKAWAPLIPFSLEEKMAGIMEEPPAQQYREKQKALQTLADRLLAASPLPDDIRIHVHYQPGDTANAFATLGGHIMIYQGLIDSIDSENALAMVLAHEIAHIGHRHPIQSLSQGLIIQLLMSAVIGDSRALQSLAGSSGLIGMASFSRAMEREADKQALVMLEKLYGHTAGAESFFRTMLEKQQQPEWTAFLQSHPGLGERIETITQSQAGNNGKLTPLADILQ